MNEIEQSAYDYARDDGATWGRAMDFARWYYHYGSNGLAYSWLRFTS